MDVEWLRQIFSSFGQVVDVFIPIKRSSSFNTKFGFIRFKEKEEAFRAIDALDGLLIRNFRIFVQLAKYSKPTPNAARSYQKVQGRKMGSFDSKWKPIISEDHCKQRALDPPSFADIVRCVSNGIKTKLVEAKEADTVWLRKSAVGQLINYCYVNTLQDLFISNGIWDAHIRPLGGLNVLLSLDSAALLNDFLLDKDNLLPNWFTSVKAWDNQSIKPSRLDELTEKFIAFDKGRMFILTEYFDYINEVVHVKINGVSYPVKVVEDPLAETSWEKRVFTSIEIKKGHVIDGKEVLVEIDPKDDNSFDFDAHEAQDKGISEESRIDLLDGVVLPTVDESDDNSFCSVDPTSVKVEDDGRDDELGGGLESFIGDSYLPNLGDQAQFSNLNVMDNSNSFVEESNSPLGNIHYAERAIHVENCKEDNQAEGNIFEEGVAYTSSVETIVGICLSLWGTRNQSKNMWILGRRKGPSGFSSSSTAEEVTHGIDGTGLTAIVTGHFLLTNLLLETMKSTARESQREGRIINVSSVYHQHPYRGGIHFDKINDKSSFGTWYAYGQSKLANILHANELAKRLKEQGLEITSNSLHPGVIATDLMREYTILGGFVKLIAKYLGKDLQQGAATTCYVALHSQVKGVSGEYFSDCNIAKRSALAKDEELAKKLWDFSLSLTNTK
ncbi:hypothetical protein Vadar_029255 [Vaccinium darrowii]|uniref:Uncharacterized protein n=1 Tax=Vaccinium darrowii TaxID=229202 RepID=A0ACB7XL63_9ERIC|nr:hypothetical protein Vadar_029255 [Vaccinium darrowii]